MNKYVIIAIVIILIIILLKKFGKSTDKNGFTKEELELARLAKLRHQAGLAMAGEDLTNNVNIAPLIANDSPPNETEEQKRKRLGEKLGNVLRRKR